jgi:hypothetical protein
MDTAEATLRVCEDMVTRERTELSRVEIARLRFVRWLNDNRDVEFLGVQRLED